MNYSFEYVSLRVLGFRCARVIYYYMCLCVPEYASINVCVSWLFPAVICLCLCMAMLKRLKHV